MPQEGGVFLHIETRNMEIRLLREKDCECILSLLEVLRHPVHLLLFTVTPDDEYSSITRQLLGELVALHTLLSLGVFDLVADAALAAELGIDKAPAIVVLDDDRNTYGIRFYGLPSGYTFGALLEAILMVGGGTSVSVQLKTKAFLDQLPRPVLLQVLVTAINPFSPTAAALAYRLACASSYIIAEAIEILAFPQLAQRYTVRDTPATIVNEHLVITGALSEADLIRHLRVASI
jgi:glutaredoxin-like protein